MNKESRKEASEQKIVGSLQEAFLLLTSTSRVIDLRRKASFEPFIKEDYKGL